MAAQVQHAVERSRFELVENGQVVGVADYRRDGDTWVFPHTEIVPARRGSGLGAVLVQGALDDVRPTGRKVVPVCWYVGEFMDTHSGYGDLAA